MRNLKLVIAYDGTRFFGWQLTPLGPTIESNLKEALEQILQHPIHLQAASRTDKGVHARFQVVNFHTSHSITTQRLLASLNSLLSKDISILSIEEATASFHPTLEAKAKEYRYFICYGAIQLPENRLYSWHHFYPLDVSKMRAAIPYFLGTKNFAAFCNVQKKPSQKDSVRTIYAIELQEISSNRLCISIKGDRFLFRMARIIVGLLTLVGRGKIEASEVPRIIASRARVQAGVTAPAHGLFLHKIFYEHI